MLFLQTEYRNMFFYMCWYRNKNDTFLVQELPEFPCGKTTPAWTEPSEQPKYLDIFAKLSWRGLYFASESLMSRTNSG